MAMRKMLKPMNGLKLKHENFHNFRQLNKIYICNSDLYFATFFALAKLKPHLWLLAQTHTYTHILKHLPTKQLKLNTVSIRCTSANTPT